MRKITLKKKKNNSLNIFKKKNVEKEKTDKNKKKKENNNNVKIKLNIFKKKNDETKNKDNNVKNKDIIFNKKNKVKNKNNNVIKDKTAIKTNKNTETKIKNKKRKRSFWKKLITAILIMGIIGVLAVTAFFAYIVLTAPEFKEEAFKVNDQTLVYDINGEIMAKLGLEHRESISYDDLPQVLVDAIIATEDSRYFQHNGVDLPRFIKASIYQILGKSGAGGASTLTMQTVKNSLTSTESEGIKGIIRKFQDVYLSVFKVEKNYTKEEIIELYVNNHYLGPSIYGVEEASKYYFGKSASDLTLPEASLIAGLFQAPNRHNPYKHIESATSRRSIVLKLMVRHGYITQEEADMANSIEISSLLAGTNEMTEYQAFVDYVTEEVIELTGKDPALVPMKIYTTMERKLQDGVNKLINDKNAYYWKDDIVQAGIAIVNVNTGAVSALSGQRNNNNAKIWSYATDTLRQPGSTAKPIFAYGPSFEYLNESSYGFYIDEPWTYTNGPSINNWDRQFYGITTTRNALKDSRNIPAVKAYQKVGSKNVQKFAYSLGLDVSYNSKSENYRIIDQNTGLDNTINEAYALGGVSEGFSPLMMAAAYSAFGSGGYYTKPYSVTKIEYRDTGEVIEPKHTKNRVMKDSTAYLINNILAGGRGGAFAPGSQIAAKTGTSNFTADVIKKLNLSSNAINDFWTVAYTSQYSAAVWYGYDVPTKEHHNKMGETYKNQLTSALWNNVMPKDYSTWKMPSSLVSVAVELETYPAKLPSQYTPENMITHELFVRGTQPTEISDRYTKLNEISNSKLEIQGNVATISWEHTLPDYLTDEYIEKHFSQAIFKVSRENLINQRKEYNAKELGDIVYGIYKETEDGTLEFIEYTKELTYQYTGNKPTTLIIKAEHSNFNKNKSEGVKFVINFIEEPTPELNATLRGNATIESNVGEYIEQGISSITVNGEEVDGPYVIIYELVEETKTTEYFNTSDLNKAVNELPAGTYSIIYQISYNNNATKKTRTIILK